MSWPEICDVFEPDVVVVAAAAAFVLLPFWRTKPLRSGNESSGLVGR